MGSQPSHASNPCVPSPAHTLPPTSSSFRRSNYFGTEEQRGEEFQSAPLQRIRNLSGPFPLQAKVKPPTSPPTQGPFTEARRNTDYIPRRQPNVTPLVFLAQVAFKARSRTLSDLSPGDDFIPDELDPEPEPLCYTNPSPDHIHLPQVSVAKKKRCRKVHVTRQVLLDSAKEEVHKRSNIQSASDSSDNADISVGPFHLTPSKATPTSSPSQSQTQHVSLGMSPTTAQTAASGRWRHKAGPTFFQRQYSAIVTK